MTAFRRCAELVGGPYDGMAITGWSLPDSLKIATDSLVLLFGSKEEKDRRQLSHKAECEGTYYAGDEYVCIDGEFVDFCSLLVADGSGVLRFPDEALSKCQHIIGENGEPIVLLSVKYHWTE